MPNDSGVDERMRMRQQLAEAEIAFDYRCGGKGGSMGPCPTSKGKQPKGKDKADPKAKINAAKEKVAKINAKIKVEKVKAKERMDKLKAELKGAKEQLAKVKPDVKDKVTKADGVAKEAATRVKEVEEKLVALAKKAAGKGTFPLNDKQMRDQISEAIGKASPAKTDKALGGKIRHKNNEAASREIASRIVNRVGTILRVEL